MHETRDVRQDTKIFRVHRSEVGQVSDWLTEKFSPSHEGTDAGL